MSSDVIRFVHVTTFFPPDGFGGDSVQVHRFVEGLGARGHEVHVVHSPDAFELGTGGKTKGLAPPPGVDVTPVSIGRRGLLSSYLAGRPLGFADRLRELTAGADVVHFHNPSLLGGPGALLLPDGPLLVYTTHEHWLLCPMHVLFRNGKEPCERETCFRCTLRHRRPPQLWRRTDLLERAVGRLDLIVSPSQFTADRHRRTFTEANIEVLRYPPPSAARVAAVGPAPERPRPYVLFAGRFEPIKGARWLAEALVEDEGYDVVLAGDGTELPAIEAAVQGRAHIHLVGKLPHGETLQWAKGALALVIPSLGYESGGAVGLEAMALGTPILVRDLGALRELVADGGGRTFDDAPSLRRAILDLLDDAAGRARLRAEALRVADPAAGDRALFDRYFMLLAKAAARTGRGDLARRAEAAVGTEPGPGRP